MSSVYHYCTSDKCGWSKKNLTKILVPLDICPRCRKAEVKIKRVNSAVTESYIDEKIGEGESLMVALNYAESMKHG